MAYRLGMPYYVFNFADDFRDKVIRRFAESYEAGRTPNPCIDCNRFMKFDRLYERAKILGCDHVATGHYARIEEQDGKFVLKKALDPAKDQSYVLYTMTQEQLAHTLFPLGGYSKPELVVEKRTKRGMAETDIRPMLHAYHVEAAPGALLLTCEVSAQEPSLNPMLLAAAIERYTGKKPQPGNFVDADGNVLGQHKGIIHYTIGQHRGLGLGQNERAYVCKICPADNTVVLGPSEALFRRDAAAADVNWISGQAPDGPIRCCAKVRYRQTEQPCKVTVEENGSVQVLFDRPQRAITPGQAVVLYDGDTVLGGGTIL